jgi:hypothetical protein
MWIRRKDYEELRSRLASLEQWRNEGYCWNFEVWSDEDHKRFDEAARVSPYGMVTLPRGKQYSVKDVVEKLMAHCGLRLKYAPGTSANLSVVKEGDKDK